MAYSKKQIANPVTGQSILFQQTAADTYGRLLEMETTYQSRSAEPPAHYHPQQEEAFTVLSGELTVRIYKRIQRLRAGDHLHIPKNTGHAMWNASNETTVVRWRVTPAMNTEHLLETAMGLASDGKTNDKGLPSILQTALLATKYAGVFRLSKPPFIIQRVVFGILKPFAILRGYKAVYRKYLD